MKYNGYNFFILEKISLPQSFTLKVIAGVSIPPSLYPETNPLRIKKKDTEHAPKLLILNQLIVHADE